MELSVYGSIENVLFSRISEQLLSSQKVGDVTYSLGFGAVADTSEEAFLHLGELVTLPGIAAYLPCVKPDRPEVNKDREKILHSPFNISIAGFDNANINYNDYNNMRAIDVWKNVISSEKKLGCESAIFAGVYLAKVDSFSGAYVKKVPTVETAPENETPINDPEFYPEYFQASNYPEYSGKIAVITGVSIDTESPMINRLGGREQKIFYSHPGSTNQHEPVIVHQHAIITNSTELPEVKPSIGETIQQFIRSTEIIDVKHVVDTSTFSQISGAFYPFRDILLK
jgi:hypothetical protein